MASADEPSIAIIVVYSAMTAWVTSAGVKAIDNSGIHGSRRSLCNHGIGDTDLLIWLLFVRVFWVECHVVGVHLGRGRFTTFYSDLCRGVMMARLSGIPMYQCWMYKKMQVVLYIASEV